jgi:steroid delta-isomerase-like uncharacterized protein
MSAEENKMVIRRYTDEVLNQGNMDTLDQVLAGNFTNHDPGNPGVVSRDDYKQFVTALRTAFPDLHFTHEDEVADGDEVAVRWTMRGTNRGELAMPEGPVPPTGKQVQVSGISILRLAGGKMVEQWIHGDNLGFLQQLGLIPAPKPAGHEPGA